jgi:hypothetical protein
MGIGHLGMGGLRLCQGISRGLDKTWSKVQETGTPPDQASLISGPTKVALLAEKLGRVIGGGFALGVGVFYAAALGTAHLFGSAWNAGLSSDVTAENRYERSTAWETLSKSRRAFYWASSALISLITLPLAGLLIGAQWTVRAVNQTFSAIGTMAKIGWTRELPAGKLYDGSTNKIFRTIGLVVGGSLGLFIGALGGTVSAGIDILHGIGSGIVSVVKASWKRDLSPIQNQEALPNRVASVARVFPGMVLLGALAGAFAGALSIAVDIIHGAALGLASSVEVAWKRDLSSIQNQEALPKNRVVSWAGVFPGMVLLGALAGAFAGALSMR